MCRGYAIDSTKRVLRSEKYEPTGDVAFDLRAKAFREVLMMGTKEAFQESHEGFQSVGLCVPSVRHANDRYWQGTYGR